MKTPCGPARKLSDRQIAQILNWNREAIEFHCAHGTLRDLAHLLGVSTHAVRGCFETRAPDSANNHPIESSQSRGRPGRPRHLNPDQIAFAVAWRSAGREFRTRHGTSVSLACTLAVAVSTIHDCIRRQGRYTQRALVATSQDSRRVSPPKSDVAVRAELLRRWSRPKT